MHYLKTGWLIVDLVSIFPFYLIGWALDNGDGGGLQTLRLIKLLRLLKLARCLKAAERLKPYVQELFMGKLELTFSALKVIELFVWLFWFTHMQARLLT